MNFIYFESKLNDFDLLIKYAITHTEVTRYENSKKIFVYNLKNIFYIILEIYFHNMLLYLFKFILWF